MPNRIIKESICTSPNLNTLSWFEEVLFYRLIVSCDDFGRFEGLPAVIRGRLFPLKSVTIAQIDDALNSLSTAGIVLRYEREGKPYLQLIAWERHQQKRAKHSKYPAPNEDSTLAGASKCNQLPAIALEKREPRNEKRESAPTREGLIFVIEQQTPAEEVRKAAIDWLDMRIASKKKPTARAVELAFMDIRKLTEDADTAVKIFEQSTLRGWAGVFPIKE